MKSTYLVTIGDAIRSDIDAYADSAGAIDDLRARIQKRYRESWTRADVIALIAADTHMAGMDALHDEIMTSLASVVGEIASLPMPE